MIVEQKLRDIQTRASEIEAQMNSGDVSGVELAKLSKEYSRLNEILPLISEYFQVVAGISDAQEMLNDAEMREIANDQLHELNHRLPDIEKNLQIALLPRDAADDNSVIMEIRAGVGGEESALFAGDLYNQYKSYALRQGWKVEVIEENATSLRGYKEIVFKIDGAGAYGRMKFESGIHRVQRVPETEAGGRIHTSAASVAVMPEAQEIDVVIEDKDIRIDIFRASGAPWPHPAFPQKGKVPSIHMNKCYCWTRRLGGGGCLQSLSLGRGCRKRASTEAIEKAERLSLTYSVGLV